MLALSEVCVQCPLLLLLLLLSLANSFCHTDYTYLTLGCLVLYDQWGMM